MATNDEPSSATRYLTACIAGFVLLLGFYEKSRKLQEEESVWRDFQMDNNSSRGPLVYHHWTAQQTLDFLRAGQFTSNKDTTASPLSSTINSSSSNSILWETLYVVDEKERFLGNLPLCLLVCASPSTLIASLLTKYKSNSGHMIIDVHLEDDTDSSITKETKISRRHSTSDSDDESSDLRTPTKSKSKKRIASSLSASSGGPQYFLPVMTVVKKRIGWLMLLFLAETFTGSVLRMFEHELSQVVALSFFVPLLIGTGGNSGSQVVTTVVRALATKKVSTSFSDMMRVVMHETVISCILGSTLGIIGFVRALIWGTSSLVAAVVGCTLPLIVIWANAVGSIVPMVVVLTGQDPAVVSAPFITTLVDATGLAIYFTMAKYILHI